MKNLKLLLFKFLSRFIRNRYFIITFQWEMSGNKGGVVAGYGELSHISRAYPSRDPLITGIKNARPTLVKVIITNIRELKKSDFNSYCKS